MANPNNQSFFVPNPPDLDQTLLSTLAALIDQRVNIAISQRFNDFDQRLQNIEQVLRAEGRIVTLQPAPQQPRQSPLLRTQHQHQQQQVQQVQQQHHNPHQHSHQVVQQITQQQIPQQQIPQQQISQQQLSQQQISQQQIPQQQIPQQQIPQQTHQSHPQQQQQLQVQQQPLQQFQPNPPPPPQNQNQNQNGVDNVNDPVMALANANGPGALGPPPSMQHQQLAPPPQPIVNNIAPIVPMEIPPEGYAISSRATMQQELDQYTIPRGYSMRMSGTRDMGKGKRKIRWICFRAGEARYSEASKAAGLPERSSKKCNCPFKFECVETFRDSNMWVVHHHITPGTTTHNHQTSDPSEDPRSRKLPPQVAAEVDGYLRQGWQVQKIMAELKKRGFNNVLSRDLYNRRQQLKREDENPVG